MSLAMMAVLVMPAAGAQVNSAGAGAKPAEQQEPVQQPGTAQPRPGSAVAGLATERAAVLPGDSPVSNAERTALRIETLSLDMHLNADSGAVITRARLRVRNGGASPLGQIGLQVSSALLWQSARMTRAGEAGSALPVRQYRVTTDTDHTGAVNELALALPKALAPGATLNLDLYYGGTLRQSGERLVRLGAPDARAAEADWDGVSDEFIGLRGFGNVLWFPVSAPAALLADGDGFAKSVSAERQRAANTVVQLSLTLEQTGPPLQTAWFLDRPALLRSPLEMREELGHARHGAVPAAQISGQTVSASGGSDANARTGQEPSQAGMAAPADTDTARESDTGQSQILTAKWEELRLDGRPVSLFLKAGDVSSSSLSGDQIAVVGADATARAIYRSAMERVLPTLKQWLPVTSGAALTVLALPSPGTQAFADGDLLVAPVRASDPAALAESLVYPIAAARMPVNAPAWMREGVPEFLRLLYVEQTGGRDRMLAELQTLTPALQQAEDARGMDPVPLRSCVDPACARDKAAFVLMMLRGMVGDAPLEQALQAVLLPMDAAGDGNGLQAGASGDAEAGRTLTRRFEAALQQSSGKDLQWFFADWFSADRGLPDLQIVQVAPRRIERGATTVTEPVKRGPRLGALGTEPQAEADDPRRSSPTAASRNTAGLPDGSWLVAVEVQNNGDAVVEVPVIVRSAGLQNQLPLRVPAHGRATIRVPFEAAPEDVWVNDGTTPEQHGSTHHRAIQVSHESH